MIRSISALILPCFSLFVVCLIAPLKARIMALAFLVNSFVCFASLFLVCSIPFVESNEITRPPLFPALFVFGDSTVDAGNNDYLVTLAKSNFPPYGRDFIDHKPTGRFSNGRLATDFIAAALGLKEALPAYLDPTLTSQDIITGVSFASGGSGFDNLTAKFSTALPLWKQVQHFKNYRRRLADGVGEKNASHIIGNALFMCSIGTNDFVISYYTLQIRRAQMNVEQYQRFLLKEAGNFIQEIYRAGARKLFVIGVAAMGCLPVVRTLYLKQFINRRIGKTPCFEEQNQVAVSFNEKLKSVLANLMHPLPDLKIVYGDTYDLLSDIVHNPGKFGFETSRIACCGTGSIGVGPCNNNAPFICPDASKYVFWDAVHPTQKVYEIMAKRAMDRDLPRLF